MFNNKKRTGNSNRSDSPTGFVTGPSSRSTSAGRPSYGGGQGGFRGRGGNGGGFRGGNSGGRGGRGKFNVKHMDILDFINKASVKTPPTVTTITHQFNDFGLDTRIETILAGRGYTTPTPIQDQAIPSVMAGRDVIGLASTGTGKTAAFLLPLINKVLNDDTQNILILAPTRELAQQIEAEFREFTRGMRIGSALCVGGMPIYRQISDLRRHPHFVIGTPGRVQDLVNRGVLPLRVFQNVVLDEVDHMLDMGFYEPILEIMQGIPTQRQTLFFSATMPPRIRSLTAQFLQSPVTIEVATSTTSHNVEQEVVRTENRDHKMEMLHELLATPEYEKVIIFNETKRGVEDLTVELQVRGFRAVSIHGDKMQGQRTRALRDFSENRASILVATDVAARGLDIKDVSHVINYTIPQTFDDYIHRIGRTGRANKKGKAVTFV